MTVHDLSLEAKEICKENYRSNCGSCPLRPVCTATPRLDRESHNEWIRNLNELAYLTVVKESIAK